MSSFRKILTEKQTAAVEPQVARLAHEADQKNRAAERLARIATALKKLDQADFEKHAETIAPFTYAGKTLLKGYAKAQKEAEQTLTDPVLLADGYNSRELWADIWYPTRKPKKPAGIFVGDHTAAIPIVKLFNRRTATLGVPMSPQQVYYDARGNIGVSLQNEYDTVALKLRKGTNDPAPRPQEEELLEWQRDKYGRLPVVEMLGKADVIELMPEHIIESMDHRLQMYQRDRLDQ